ncbi:conjugal transfer protein TraN [Succinimonas sp.]|uniref:conjugal transfer protein TraN n=1 Tax=Succinimonas sp. TaxID=1936151 RepID=UPI00386A8FC3
MTKKRYGKGSGKHPETAMFRKMPQRKLRKKPLKQMVRRILRKLLTGTPGRNFGRFGIRRGWPVLLAVILASAFAPPGALASGYGNAESQSPESLTPREQAVRAGQSLGRSALGSFNPGDLSALEQDIFATGSGFQEKGAKSVTAGTSEASGTSGTFGKSAQGSNVNDAMAAGALELAETLSLREPGSQEKERLLRERPLYTAAMEMPAGENSTGNAASCTPRERMRFQEVRCPAPVESSPSCHLVHVFSSDMTEADFGTGLSFRPCQDNAGDDDGTACYEFWVGDTRDNSLSGNCSIFEAETGFTVKYPELVSSLELAEVFYDDYLQIWGNTEGDVTGDDVSHGDYQSGDRAASGKPRDRGMAKIMSFPNESFPPETPGPCELSESRHEYPGRDIWPLFRNRIRPGEPLHVRLRERVSVTGNGEGYMLFRLRFKAGALSLDEYRGLECLKNLPQDRNWEFVCESRAQEISPGSYDAGGLPVTRDSFTRPREFQGGLSELWDPFCLEGTVREARESAASPSGDIAGQDWKDGQEAGQDGGYGGGNSGQNGDGNTGWNSASGDSCGALGLYRYCERSYAGNNEGDRGGNTAAEVWKCADEIPCPANIADSGDSEIRDGASDQTSRECKRVTREITVPENGVFTERRVCGIYRDDKGQVIDECQGFQEQGCVLAQRDCLDPEKDPGEFCGSQTLVWDCPREFTSGRKLRETVIDCPGQELCTGTSCTGTVTEEAGDITGAMLSLQLMNYMQDDISCIGADGSRTVDCRIFQGEERECREGYGGKMRCCTDGGATDITDYVRLTAYTLSLKSALGAVRATEPVFGSWARREALRDSTGLISSSLDSIVASAGEESARAAAQGFTEVMTRKLADFVAETFGDEFRNALFTETVNEGGAMTVELNTTVAACANWAMTAYVAYQLGRTVFKMMTACKPEEQETALRIGLKSCIYQGSTCSVKVLKKCVVHKRRYCCYSSPLARIVMSRPEAIEIAGGTCGGIPLGRLSEIDLSSIDLSEWAYYLDRSGLLPDGEFSLESLTGSGSALNTGHRDNTAVRTEKRLQNLKGGD